MITRKKISILDLLTDAVDAVAEDAENKRLTEAARLASARTHAFNREYQNGIAS
ncbi:MAG: hypothetical protein J6X67_11875 [Treponema sp.]|nr:hypothetical protein [Treponema sp.]